VKSERINAGESVSAMFHSRIHEKAKAVTPAKEAALEKCCVWCG